MNHFYNNTSANNPQQYPQHTPCFDNQYCSPIIINCATGPTGPQGLPGPTGTTGITGATCPSILGQYFHKM